MVVGLSVGALLVARIAGGPGLSGVAQSAVAVGGALLALPVARVMQARGRRPGLMLGYAAAAIGAALVVTAAALNSVLIALVGMFLFGGATTANGQARYTATDLATPERRGRHLSTVIWATTIGAVAGPMLAAPADRVTAPFGLPPLAGPFVFSLLAFLAAGVVLMGLLRPDPLLTARRLSASGVGARSGAAATPEGGAEP
ncbi:MAG: MFS transporter, partial [Micromonosporaceae bacterium]|nr:MFS transporter [Micromonosporaceae bacterium]